MPTSTATRPTLVLKPDFAGNLDFELATPDKTITRVNAAAGSASVPGLFAPIFEDPFALPDELEESLADWLENASPPPAVSVRSESGDLPATLSGALPELPATLSLTTSDRHVTVARTVGNNAAAFIPLGASLVFLTGSLSFARVSNPAAWRALDTAALDFDLAPVTPDGRAFRTSIPAKLATHTFNEAAVSAPSPLPPGLLLEAATITPSTSLDIQTAGDTATLTFNSDPPLPSGATHGRQLLQATAGTFQLLAPPRLPHLPFPTRTAVPLDDLKAALPSLYHTCRDHGITLRYNTEPVVESALDITVAADDPDEKNEIDWFELRPEVSCIGFRLSDAEWELVLTHGFFDPATRGQHRRAPVIIARHALKKLEHVRSARRTRHDRPGKVTRTDVRTKSSRLRVLDWLNLARAGVHLDLPQDDREIVDALLSGAPAAPATPPGGVNADLRPYQVHGYQWLSFLYRYRFGAVLADDMGLGKTLQTITFLAGVSQNKTGRTPSGTPHLIVLPPTLVFNWASELKKFYPAFGVYEYTGGRRSLTKLKNCNVALTTYDIVRRDFETLKAVEFDVVAFDEAQAVKTFTSSRSRAARHIRSRFTVCLTGTPYENHLGEYYSIVDLALPGLLGDHRTFVEDVGDNPDHPRVARAIPFVLRRTKEKLLSELPAKIDSDIYLDLTEDQKELYTRTVAEVREEVAEAYLKQTRQQAAISALAALTRLRQACIAPALLLGPKGGSSPKLDHLASSLAELSAEGHAALIFSQFTRALDLVEPALEAQGVSFIRLDGKTPKKDREGLVNAFQADGGPSAFLISLKTGASGLNLTRASYVFHLDPWWNPAVENQASARAHRWGQKNTVVVQRLLMRHTVEEKMMELKERKQQAYDRLMAAAEANTVNPASPAAAPFSSGDLDFLLAP
ncbi:MAG: DEAD/DEAH box helicase [Verrucomicrobiales bacterium]|nr:DEAD/DEAH box helicase [Verrucomicrobiales bacterium]